MTGKPSAALKPKRPILGAYDVDEDGNPLTPYQKKKRARICGGDLLFDPALRELIKEFLGARDLHHLAIRSKEFQLSLSYEQVVRAAVLQ